MSEDVALVDLGFRARDWQAEARARLKRFSVLVVHRRGGKTVLAVVTLVDAALRTTKERPRYAYIAPFRNQAKAVAWDYLKAYATRIPGCVVNEGELHVTLPNGAQIRLFGADNPDALRGLYFDGLVVDEVADMPPEVWGEILRPALADRKGWALFIGTPKGINLFSQVYFDALSDPTWHAALYTIHDTQALDAEELASARATMSVAQFRQEFLCDFQASSDDQLLSIEDFFASVKRAPKETDVEHHPKVMGLDVARYGNDWAVLAKRQGPLLLPLRKWHGLNNMDLAAQVAHEWQTWGADACFVDNGRGEGVIDRLRALRFSPVGIDFGGKTTKVGFVNKGVEMWADAAAWIRTVGAVPDDPRLRAAFCTRKVHWDNPHGWMDLETKKQMRKRGVAVGLDEGDAVALTHALPVVAKVHPYYEHFMSRQAARTVFDDHGWRA